MPRQNVYHEHRKLLVRLSGGNLMDDPSGVHQRRHG